MFANLPGSSRIMYRALLSMVQSNAGVGFHNNDQGHTAYVVGRDGIVDLADFGDCPDENTLYQMMKALSRDLRSCSEFDKDELVNTWEDFCRIATDAYNTHSRTL